MTSESTDEIGKKVQFFYEKLHAETQYHIKIIYEKLADGSFSIEYIKRKLIRFMKLVIIEDVQYIHEGYKKTREWILNNMYLVLLNKLIKPEMADEEICTIMEFEKYSVMLDIYYEYGQQVDNIAKIDKFLTSTKDLSEEMIKNQEKQRIAFFDQIIVCMTVFFMVDTHLKLRCDSKHDLSLYILNNI